MLERKFFFSETENQRPKNNILLSLILHIEDQMQATH